MSLDWNVHTPMAGNTWHPLEDAAPVIDPKSMLATLTLPVLFRGSRAQMLAAFRFGNQNSPHGGTAMFCLGPQRVGLVPFTDHSGLQHWTGEVTWAGIHNQILTGGLPYAFVTVTKYASRETSFPLSVSPTGGGGPIYYSPGKPIVPNGFSNITGIPWKGRRLDHLPARTVRGVMLTSIEPYPYHPHIMVTKARFLPPLPSVVSKYAAIAALDPVYVTWEGGNVAPATPSAGSAAAAAWFCREIDTLDRYAPFNGGATATSLYSVQATFSYEQLVQAS